MERKEVWSSGDRQGKFQFWLFPSPAVWPKLSPSPGLSLLVCKREINVPHSKGCCGVFNKRREEERLAWSPAYPRLSGDAGLPVPASYTCTLVLTKSPQTSASVGSHLEDLGYHGNLGSTIPGPCFTQLHLCPQPSPAQLWQLPRQQDCVGHSQPSSHS